MRRRDFFGAVSGMAATALVARAQERVRRLGALMNSEAEDPIAQSYVAAFRQGMQEFGWSEGRNLHVELRWGGTTPEIIRRHAVDLVALSPDIILAAGGPAVYALQRVTRTIPIVFAQSIDPVGSAIVASLARPRGNATGFTQFEYSLSSKWVELLKEIVPGARRLGVLREAINPAGIGQWAIIQAAATAVGMEVTPIGVGNPRDIERDIAAFAQEPNGALVVAVSSNAIRHRSAIIASAAQHRLAAVYPYQYFVAGGGLVSYGADLLGQYRRAASYVDRILKGEAPSELPVQAPTRYELAVNLKTAKTLGLTIPPSVLARVDEVIE